MDFLTQNWGTIIATLVALFGVFKWLNAVKYVNFAKEIGDIYVSYEKGIAADSPGGKDFTTEEYTDLGRQVVEAVESGKVTFKKQG